MIDQIAYLFAFIGGILVGGGFYGLLSVHRDVKEIKKEITKLLEEDYK